MFALNLTNKMFLVKGIFASKNTKSVWKTLKKISRCLAGTTYYCRSLREVRPLSFPPCIKKLFFFLETPVCLIFCKTPNSPPKDRMGRGCRPPPCKLLPSFPPPLAWFFALPLLPAPPVVPPPRLYPRGGIFLVAKLAKKNLAFFQKIFSI